MKKSYVVFSTVAVAAMLFSVTSCGKKGASGSGKGANKLVVWSFTDELQTMIEKYYQPSHPGVEVEYSLTPTDQFPNKLDPVLASGNGAPDVFALEDAFVRKYIEQGPNLLLDITDEYNAVKNKMIAYPGDIGSYNGRVYGISWQAAPGALFYRRSLAKKYLGTDDPVEVQKQLNSWNAFLNTARKLRDASKGNCVILSTTGDLFKPFMSARKSPWVVNGKLVIDPAAREYMQMAKQMKDEGLEGRTSQWAEGWFAGMKGELKDEAGKPVEVFAYMLPTWGLHYVLKANAGNTSGDWAMCEGPAPYRWGGTWAAAYKGTKVPDLAKEFLMYVGSDDVFLEAWAKDTGDIVSNNNVINKIKDTYTEPFLGGQNHYAEFAKMANGVDGRLTQGTDQAIEGFFGEAVGAYVNGEMSLDEAIADFTRHVSEELGF